jgi:SAM-dependent methyltransferase
MDDSNPKFDAYAQTYDAALAKGLAVSGESREFFARKRLEYLRDQLQERGFKPRRLLDFGCGTGSATPLFFEILGIESLVGVDVSPASLEVAARDWKSFPAQFSFVDECNETDFDLAFCNGVFHHIAPAKRAESAKWVNRALRGDGLFSFWENNPWNPGTRLVMGRCPFDDDAITLAPPESRRLLQSGGFEIESRDFLFTFHVRSAFCGLWNGA